MRDRDIVAAIVASDPAGLAAAYDRYAADLFSYCQVLLTEPADAADAVQDTFVIAAGKVSALRDPDRLRPWLYAVARNECHRRLRTRDSATPLDESAEVSDDTADLGAGLEQAEIRELVWAALAGLTESEREIIELTLGHELTGADLADTLGVPRNQAHAMASRARAHFEAALGVLLVARSGQDACAELAAHHGGLGREADRAAAQAGQPAHPAAATSAVRGSAASSPRTACSARCRWRRCRSRCGTRCSAWWPIPRRPRRPGGWPSASGSGRSGPAASPGRSSPPSSLRLAGQHVRAGTAAGGAIIVGGALLAGGAILHHHAGQGPGGAPGAHPEPSVSGPARAAGGGPGGAAGPSGGARRAGRRRPPGERPPGRQPARPLPAPRPAARPRAGRR